MNIPIVRFKIEALGEQIYSQLMIHAEDVSAEVMAGVKDAADNLDIAGIAKQAASKAIEDSVNSCVTQYFQWGEGKKIIEEMVGSSIRGAGES
jgi:hypothetical protein